MSPNWIPALGFFLSVKKSMGGIRSQREPSSIIKNSPKVLEGGLEQSVDSLERRKSSLKQGQLLPRPLPSSLE